MKPLFGGFFAMAMHRAMAHPMWGGFPACGDCTEL